MTPTAAMVPPAVTCRAAADAQAGLRLGIGLTLTALVGISAVMYALPPNTDAHYWGLNPEGMQQFRAHWGVSPLPPIGLASLSLVFRLLLVVFWSGYALAVLSARHGAVLRAKPLSILIGGTGVLTALFSPPLLSHDVYAYAAHGRLADLYGQNPYFHTPLFLARVRDPAAAFVTWNWPTVYGPVWTRIEIATVALLPGLWAQVIGLKLVEAGALVGAALAGRRIAAKISPGCENLTLLAIGLNPLLLLEGPVSGHNDLLVACLLLLGAMFYFEKKYFWAALFLGLSVGIKMITLAVLPWAGMEWASGRTFRQKLRAIPAALLLALLPTVLCYFGLWHGAQTLAAMQARSLYHADAATLIRNAEVSRWLSGRGVTAFPASALVALVQNRWLLGVFAALSLWLRLRPLTGQWLTAWAVLAALLMFFALGLPFPWYICWFWPVCLLRWDRVGLILSTACFGLSLTWTAGYGILTSLR